jgi:hypothetical protein
MESSSTDLNMRIPTSLASSRDKCMKGHTRQTLRWVTLVVWNFIRYVQALETPELKTKALRSWGAYTATMLFAMTIKRENLLLAIVLGIITPFVLRSRGATGLRQLRDNIRQASISPSDWRSRPAQVQIITSSPAKKETQNQDSITWTLAITGTAWAVS